MKQFIIKLPEGERFAGLSDEVKLAIKAVGGQFPSGRVVGSHAVNGYELKLVMCSASSELLAIEFDILALDWEVLAEEGLFTDDVEILPHLDLDITYDDEGEILSSESKTDLSSLQTFAGHSWT